METKREYDYMFKILLMGASGVGKTCLLLRFADDSYTDTYISTLGVEFKFKTLRVANKIVRLQIWDTAGQERFKSITANFYRGSHGVILVGDLADPKSNSSAQYWLHDIKRMVHHSGTSESSPQNSSYKEPPIIFVANKLDLVQPKKVDHPAKDFAHSFGLEYFETSAKTGEGVEDAFVSLTRKVLEERTSHYTEEEKKVLHLSPSVNTKQDHKGRVCCWGTKQTT